MDRTSKFCSLVAMLSLAFLVNSALADVHWRDYDPNDHYWSSGDNWGTGASVPTTASGTVYIKAGLAAAYGQPDGGADPIIISDVPDVARLNIGKDGSGAASVTLDSGSLSVVDDSSYAAGILRLGHYSTTASDVHGQFYLNAGDLVAETRIDVGSRNTDGTFVMNGGTLTTPTMIIPGSVYSTAVFEMFDGEITLSGTSYPLNITIDDGATKQQFGSFIIHKGKITAPGNLVSSWQWYLDSGRIVYDPCDPRAQLSLTSDDITTVLEVTIPGAELAYNPTPANGVEITDLDQVLSWSPGDGALSHDVYFGTDEDAVANATDPGIAPGQGNQAGTTFDPGGLALGQTYFWRIDEVDASTTHTGDVWQFSLPDHITVEDFQTYDANDIDDNWIASGGGTVELATAPIIYQSTQALKLTYDNSTGNYSAATLTLASPQDWTVGGLEALFIPVHGAAGNGLDPVYLTLEDGDGDTITVNFDEPEELDQQVYEGYLSWDIALADLTGAAFDLNAVAKITVGIGDQTSSTGSGVLYVDDIRLYIPRCLPDYSETQGDFDGDCMVDENDLNALICDWLATSYIATAEPVSATGLLAHYKFDDGSGATVGDETGNNAGTLTNGIWHASGGADGGYLEFDGNSYVSVLTAADMFSTVDAELTISVWVNGDAATQPNGDCLLSATNAGYLGHNPFIYMPQADGIVRFDAGHTDIQEPDWASYYYGWDMAAYEADPTEWEGQWVHYAFVKNTTTGKMKIYRNGELMAKQLLAERSMAGVAYFTIGALDRGTYTALKYHGGVDDLRVYDRELSQGEILTLAGQTSVSQELVSPVDFNEDGSINLQDFSFQSQSWMQEVLWP